MILYGINLSTFTRKARLALAEKAIDYRLEVAPMGSPQVRALNPLGRIPVLDDAGLVIADSSVIIAYLERAYPARALYPESPAELARALWLEEYADTRLREATVPFFAERIVKPLFQRKPADTAALDKAGPLRDECFDYLEAELPATGCAVGGKISVADVAVVAQLVTYYQGEGEIVVERWPRLARYYDELTRRPAWAEIIAEEGMSLAAARSRRA
jgi:glutathione S-transferase